MSQTSPVVRDRFTWLAYLMLAYFAYLQTCLGPLMPFLRAELDLNYTLAGLHFSAFALGMILAGLTADRFAGCWGRRLVFWGGGAGMAVGALCLVLSRQAALTIASALLMGWLGANLVVMIQATLSDRHGEQRAVALTESNLAASLSAGLVPLFIGGLQRLGVGWRGALVLAVLVLAVIAARFLGVEVPEAQRPTAQPGSIGQTLPVSFWAYWIVLFLVVSVEWCLVFWGADFLENTVGLSKVSAVSVMSMFFLAMVMGRYIGSHLTRVMPSTSLLLIALGISLVGFPIFWLAPVAPVNLAGLFITGLGVANLFPLTLAIGVGVAPRQPDVASARVSLGAGLAIFIAPFVLGWTADRLTIRNAYGVVAVLLVGAIALAAFTNRQVRVSI